MHAEPPPSPPSRSLVLAAFATVYMSGVRPTWRCGWRSRRCRRSSWPAAVPVCRRSAFALFASSRRALARKVHWGTEPSAGSCLLVGGNGLVVWAEQTVPSVSPPSWSAWFPPVRAHRLAPARRLAAESAHRHGDSGGIGRHAAARSSCAVFRSNRPVNLWGAAALLLAGICWAAGSLFSKHQIPGGITVDDRAVQMLRRGVD